MRILSVKHDSGELELKRQKLQHRTKILQITKLMLFCVTVIGVTAFIVNKFRPALESPAKPAMQSVEIVKPSASVTDENRQQIPSSIIDYAGKLERELTKSGLKPEKFILPSGKTRELHVYIIETKHFFKVNTDRSIGETAEDIIRMSKYVESQGLKNLTYIDVRIPGRAYYK